MRPIHFQHSMRDSVHVWRYVVDHPCVEDDYQPLAPEEGPYPPFLEFGVSRSNRAEVVVYARLTWKLTEGLQRLAIPCFHDWEFADWTFTTGNPTPECSR